MVWLTWVAANGDGTRLGVGTQDGAFFLFDPVRREVVERFDAGGHVVRAAFAPDGRLLVARRDGCLLVRAGDGRGDLRTIDTGHGDLRGLAVDADGARWATCGTDGKARVWDAATAQPVFELADGEVAAMAVGFAENSIAVGYADGFLVAWDDAGREKRMTGRVLPSAVHALAVHPSGKRIVVGGERGRLAEILVDEPDWRLGRTCDEPPRPIAVNAIAFARDGRFAAACSDDCARIFPDRGSLVVGMRRLGEPFHFRRPNPGWQQQFIVAGACWVPGTDLVATCHFDGCLRLWGAGGCATVDFTRLA